MLHEFLIWAEAKARAKGEEYTANHRLELLAMIEGLSQSEGMELMRKELAVLKSGMELEYREHGYSIAHGAMWTKMLNVEQALQGGAGKLFFKDYDPREKV